MTGKKYDIAINMTLHNEGDLFYKTAKSIVKSIEFIKQKNPKIKIMINCCLDSPDNRTTEYFNKHKNILKDVADDFNEFKVNYRDVSKSRNYLIDHCLKNNAEYIRIVDADDIYSKSHLYRMYETAIKQKEPTIVIHEFLINLYEIYGILKSNIYRYKSSDSKEISLISMFSKNIYTSSIFAHSSVFKKNKYTPNDKNYRYEDYNFLLKAISNDCKIIVAPKTFILYRRKDVGSVLNAHNSDTGLCLAPTKFFSPEVFAGLSTNDEKNEIKKETLKERALKSISPGYYVIPMTTSRLHNILRLTRASFIEFAKLSLSSITKGMIYMGLWSKPEENSTLMKNGFDNDLLDELKAVNEYEPLAAYDRNWINNTKIKTLLNSTKADEIYYDLCNLQNSQKATDLILVPHITAGGADKAMIDLCTALSKKNRYVLMIATNNNKNDWADRVSALPNCSFFNLGQFLDEISSTDVNNILLRIVQNWPNLKTMTIMSSLVGYKLVQQYNKEIEKFVKVIFHDWTYQVLDLKMKRPTMPLAYAFRENYTLITDGQKYKDELMEINGWDGSNIKVVGLPIRDVTVKKDYDIKKKIFFAGRFCMQKRIDCIIPILDKLNEKGIHVDFWGGIDTTDEGYTERRKTDMEGVKNAPNAEYRGPFNDFAKLPMDDYDLMIMPTEFEGLPNIVLEALKANMYVISGNAGSIPYVVKDYKNGYIVQDGGDAQGYLDAVLDFYNNQDKILNPDERRKFNDEILKDHDIAVYEKTIAEIYGL